MIILSVRGAYAHRGGSRTTFVVAGRYERPRSRCPSPAARCTSAAPLGLDALLDRRASRVIRADVACACIVP